MILDHKDSIVLTSALDANPSCLVTGDKDFHTEHLRTKVVVITASQAMSLLSIIGLPESHDHVNDQTIDSQAEHGSDHASETCDSNVHTELAWSQPGGTETR
jgi:hypothetical protein